MHFTTVTQYYKLFSILLLNEIQILWFSKCLNSVSYGVIQKDLLLWEQHNEFSFILNRKTLRKHPYSNI